MDQTVATELDTEKVRSRANLTLVGLLLAHMVYQEVTAGRWYVDSDGCAHPLNGQQLEMVVQERDEIQV